MTFILWVLQVLLALAFLAHGWMFLFPPASLLEQMNAAIAPGFRLFLGAAEVLAANRTDLAGHHAHSALAGSVCSRWIDDRHEQRHGLSRCTG
jgi:uncharacterized membrane protein YphA (DoxX/SURF4 family)